MKANRLEYCVRQLKEDRANGKVRLYIRSIRDSDGDTLQTLPYGNKSVQKAYIYLSGFLKLRMFRMSNLTNSRIEIAVCDIHGEFSIPVREATAAIRVLKGFGIREEIAPAPKKWLERTDGLTVSVRPW